MGNKPGGDQPANGDQPAATDYGFYLTVASSAPKPTTIQIQSTLKFKSGDESLVINQPISLDFSKLNTLLKNNQISLPTGVSDRIQGLRITLPFFYYNTGGTPPKDGASGSTATFFFALTIGSYNEDGSSKGLLSTLTGVEGLETFFDILELGIVVGKGPKVSIARSLMAQAQAPALPASSDSA